MALERDGALCIRIESGRVWAAGAPNWLPTPPGAFELVLSLTWPAEEALERRWLPPPVTREGRAVNMSIGPYADSCRHRRGQSDGS